jgi:hypothetical protein
LPIHIPGNLLLHHKNSYKAAVHKKIFGIKAADLKIRAQKKGETIAAPALSSVICMIILFVNTSPALGHQLAVLPAVY